MLEDLLKDEQHPYHHCACAIQAVTEAKRKRLEILLAQLMADRGRVRAVKFSMGDDCGDNGVPLVYIDSIGLELDDLTEIHFGQTLILDQLDEVDDPTYAGEPVIGYDEDPDDRNALLAQRIADISGIDPARLEGWLWLANHYAWLVHEDSTEIVLVPPG